MSYLLLDLVFLTAAGILTALLSTVPASKRHRKPSSAAQLFQRHRRLRPAPALAAGLVLLALTVVFDNAMIAAGLFGYAPQSLSGMVLGLVPVEDFAYPIAAAVLIPALWHRLARDDNDPGEGNRRHAVLSEARGGTGVRKHQARRMTGRAGSGARP